MKKLLLKNVTILDGTKDMVPLPNQDILIEGDRIIKIGQSINEPSAKIIDLTNKYIIPGLINLHVHLPGSGKVGKKKVSDLQKLVSFIINNPIGRLIGLKICKKNALMHLKSGVTTIRTVGGLDNFDSILAKKFMRSTGPRIISCDTAIGVKNGHMVGTVAKGVSSIEEAKELIDENIFNGAHQIKLMITGGILDCKVKGHPGDLHMQEELIKECTEYAHEKGLKVAAHVEGEEGFNLAVKYHIDTIEHGADVNVDTLLKLKEYGGALICTLSPAVPIVKLDIKGYDEVSKYNGEALLKGMINVTNNALQNNVIVGLGNDTGCPYVFHYDFYRELIYFTKLIKNTTPKDALHIATEVNASILGLEDKIGTIKENKIADLVILDESPLDNLNSLKNPTLVISKGKLIKPNIKKNIEIDKQLDKLN